MWWWEGLCEFGGPGLDMASTVETLNGVACGAPSSGCQGEETPGRGDPRVRRPQGVETPGSGDPKVPRALREEGKEACVIHPAALASSFPLLPSGWGWAGCTPLHPPVPPLVCIHLALCLPSGPATAASPFIQPLPAPHSPAPIPVLPPALWQSTVSA